MSTPTLPVQPISITPVGSRVTCSPAPTDADRDWLLFVGAGSLGGFCSALEGAGWELGGSGLPDEANELPPEAHFLSFTKGEDNLILTESEVFHRRFIAATTVAARLNLLDKGDRIALFQAVLYANACGVIAQ